MARTTSSTHRYRAERDMSSGRMEGEPTVGRSSEDRRREQQMPVELQKSERKMRSGWCIFAIASLCTACSAVC